MNGFGTNIFFLNNCFQMMNTYTFPNFTAYKEPKASDAACVPLSNKFQNAAFTAQCSYSIIVLSSALIYYKR